MKYCPGILIAMLILMFVSCGPSQEDRARMRLDQARKFLQDRDTAKALLEVDSIPVLFPKAMYSVKAAKDLKNTINMDKFQRYNQELDSLESSITQLEKNFIKEKGEFDQYIQYTYKRQNFNQRWNKSFLQVHLNEMGDIYFSSNYYGEHWLNHTGIRVYDGKLQAKTDKVPLGDVNNHHSDFMDEKWEKVTYRNGKEENVIKFIAENANRNLKAVFLGSRYYYIILESYDKEAFKEAYQLSLDLKKRIKLNNEIKQLQAALNIES